MKGSVLRNAAIVAMASTSMASAAAYVWVGLGGGYYSAAGSWSCSGGGCQTYPDSTDADVLISNPGAVYLDVDSEVDDLTLWASGEVLSTIDGLDSVNTVEAETITFSGSSFGGIVLTGSAVIKTVDR
ncbi:MAG: hypothetical protein C4547_13395 [Phycisphaerales bacterium]|nr:MAG: hypothetical protein C4547_13395 [Phycisphaerales bacterium]